MSLLSILLIFSIGFYGHHPQNRSNILAIATDLNHKKIKSIGYSKYIYSGSFSNDLYDLQQAYQNPTGKQKHITEDCVKKAAVRNFFNKFKKSNFHQAADIITSAEQIRLFAQLKNSYCITNLDEALQQELLRSMQESIVSTDLTKPINETKIKKILSHMCELHDIAKLTDNFKKLDRLNNHDILRINNIIELSESKNKIKKFLDIHKPYFIHENSIYFVKDIAFYHIHAGEYFLEKSPSGGHSNFGGNKLDCFRPKTIQEGPFGTKYVVLHNSRFPYKCKESSIYPETWSEYRCDLEALNLMRSQDVKILGNNLKYFTFRGKTSEGLDIIVHYDVSTKTIKSHYPDAKKF